MFRFCCWDLLPQSLMSSHGLGICSEGHRELQIHPRMGWFSLWILQYQLFFISHGFLLPQNQGFLCRHLLLPTPCPWVRGWSCYQDSFKISLYNCFHHFKEKWLPAAESRFQHQSLFQKKKNLFWLVGCFFPLKRRQLQNNLLHPAQHGKRKYPVQLHLVGAFRNNFNSHFLLNVSPFVCITHGCLAVEAKLWPPTEASVLFAALSHHNSWLTAPELCQGLCGTVWALVWAPHGTSLGTGANWANHLMGPPWKIITSALCILHVRLVFPCSNRGGCTWVLIKAFPFLLSQKASPSLLLSMTSKVQVFSCRYLKDFQRKIHLLMNGSSRSHKGRGFFNPNINWKGWDFFTCYGLEAASPPWQSDRRQLWCKAIWGKNGSA